jgi:hypothetical protein
MREAVRTTITIYYDRVGACMHILMCDVFEGGEHEVRMSEIRSTSGTTLAKTIKWWEDVVGKENIRAYNITEHVQDAGVYGFVSTDR